mmetsp:Transcript_14770/g.27665  ORF Transcript_14770/g.27665 Transcript_14770/m.27665 type:complete len:317 (-) Transcript_14770:19-969(-)
MLHRVFGYTTNLGPAIALDGVLVVGPAGLEQGLVGTTSTGNNSDLGTNRRGNGLLTTRRQTQTSGSLVFIVSDDNGKCSRASGKGTTVSALGFDVANDGTFRDGRQRQDISDSQGSFLSAVDELTSVHAFCAEEQLAVSFVSVGVQELHTGNGSTTTGIMHNILDDTTDVALFFGIVQRTKLDRSLAGTDVCLEDGGLTLSLGLHNEIRTSEKVRVQSNSQSIVLYHRRHCINSRGSSFLSIIDCLGCTYLDVFSHGGVSLNDCDVMSVRNAKQQQQPRWCPFEDGVAGVASSVLIRGRARRTTERCYHSRCRRYV